jgi:FkbM family methyltransferase
MKILPNGIAVIEGDTHISKWVEESGRLDHDQYALPIILQHIKKGDAVVDAGAFIGDHTKAYIDKVGPNGTVYAFEPNRKAFKCLTHNCPTARYVNAGLGIKKEMLGMVFSENAGASHIIDGGDNAAIIDLDEYKFKRVDFIKLDIEGFETFALIGAAGTIKRCRPIMWIEVNSGALERAGSSVGELYNIITELDYKWTAYPEESGPQYDILCIPQ